MRLSINCWLNHIFPEVSTERTKNNTILQPTATVPNWQPHPPPLPQMQSPTPSQPPTTPTLAPSRPTNKTLTYQNPSPRTQSIPQKINSAFWASCYDGAMPEVNTIFQKYDPDVNKPNIKGQTPLWIACFQGHFEVVHFLLTLCEVRPVTVSFSE